MNEKTKALKTASNVLSVIMKIGFVVAIVALCICAVALIFMLATGGETSIVTAGGVNIILASGSDTTPEVMAGICIELLVMFAFLLAIFLLTYRMFHEISKTGSPFEEKHVKSMKAIGILVAAMTVAMGIVDFAVASLMKTPASGISDKAPGVVVGVIIFCLAYIIDYGCALQKVQAEVD